MQRFQIRHRVEHLFRPHMTILGHRFPAFHLCGYAGLLLMVATMLALTELRGLSLAITAGLLPLAAVIFLGSAMLSKILTGVEQIVYYRIQITIVAVAALLLRLIGAPVGAYLDLLILGIGAFTAAGRIGCLMVGCCHGTPSRNGICYHDRHAREGFPSALVAVPLIPVQLMESLWVALVVAVGIAMLLAGSGATGSVVAWYTIAYGVGRYFLEFRRGDPERPYLLGISEAQWTSLATIGVVIAAEQTGLLAPIAWHALLFGLLLLLTAGVIAGRATSDADFRFRQPRHIIELARAIRAIDAEALLVEAGGERRSGGIPARTTSEGMTISTSITSDPWRRTYHYAFSSVGGAIAPRDARELARLIQLLSGHPGYVEVIEGRGGIHHLLIQSARATPEREVEEGFSVISAEQGVSRMSGMSVARR